MDETITDPTDDHEPRDGPTAVTATDPADDLEPPSFRGCVFCYTAEWAVYGGRRLYRSVSE